MSDYLVKCKCGNFMPEEDFSRHFGRCEEFRKYFKNFDQQFGEILKQNSDPKENLLIIRVLLKQYVSLLDKKIDTIFCNDPQFQKQNLQNNGGHGHDSRNIDFEMEIKNDPIYFPLKKEDPRPVVVNPKPVKPSIEPKQQEPFIECCQICKDPNFTYLECVHPICINCFHNDATKNLHKMKCIQCNEAISEGLKRAILGNEEYEKIENKILIDAVGGIVECPQCKAQNTFEKGKIDYNIKNDKNEKLSQQAAEDYAHNRARCPYCKIDFCATCKLTPYHIGKTCIEQKNFVQALKCRYDDTVIQMNNRGPADDVCSNIECVNIFKTACTKVLKCGHKCWGCLGEKVCQPCLDKECQMYQNIYDQCSDSYCNICFTEGLGNAPVILLSCKHYIHYKCLYTRLTKKWVGPKITFNHCLCPQCNKWAECTYVPDISKLITENKSLYDDICKKALERLKFEGLSKDVKLTDPNSRWYKNELAYALNRLSYYMCYECKKPYFAGLRECGEGPNVNNNNPDRPYDPKDLICGAHVNNSGVAGMTECKVHGKEFIEYKCKFCCNIASWFCWGTTHFCEDCHAKQCKGDYVSKYAKDKLPKCDTSKCCVKGKHPENGEEFGLGCSVCRNNNENLKDF